MTLPGGSDWRVENLLWPTMVDRVYRWQGGLWDAGGGRRLTRRCSGNLAAKRLGMDRCRVGDYLTDEVRLLRVVSVRQVGAFPSACKVIVLEDAIEFDVDDRGDRVYKKRSYPEQEVDELRLLVLDLHETPV